MAEKQNNLLYHALVILGKNTRPTSRTFSVSQQVVLLDLLRYADRLTEHHVKMEKALKNFMNETAYRSKEGDMVTFFTKDWEEFCNKWLKEH